MAQTLITEYSDMAKKAHHPNDINKDLNRYFALKNGSLTERVVAKQLQKRLKKKGLNIR